MKSKKLNQGLIAGNLILLLLLFFNCRNKDSEHQHPIETSDKTELATEQNNQLRHTVLFKFKDNASAEDIQRVVDAFATLPNKIPEIKKFEWGLNNSPENLNKDFTHCFFLTFESEQGREIYLPHPDHKAFVDIVGPVLDDVLVFDYWTEN